MYYAETTMASLLGAAPLYSLVPLQYDGQGHGDKHIGKAQSERQTNRKGTAAQLTHVAQEVVTQGGGALS
jgi:hypothetical protein